MQNKTINNALIALAKQSGSQAKLAEVLLDMRGFEWNGWVQDNPFKRGGTKRIVMDALMAGPMNSWQLGEGHTRVATRDRVRRGLQSHLSSGAPLTGQGAGA